jgi:hypothetical protein
VHEARAVLYRRPVTGETVIARCSVRHTAAARFATICSAILLAGCSSLKGDASVGPNPGGGFYEGPNMNVGHINLCTVVARGVFLGKAIPEC